MSLRNRILGERDRLGWWLVPLFAITGLAGAVLAGSLATVYYAQQVSRLERETAAAREELATAVDDVQAAAEEALEAIGREVDAVRDRLAQELPVGDPVARGVVRLRVEATLPPRQPEPQPSPDPEGPPPPAAEPEQISRRAVGFVIARDGDTTFLVTTFALLQDPRNPDRPLDVPVRVVTPAGEVEGRAHNWDADRDLLLLRAGLPPVEPLEWRPADSPVAAGDRVVGIGLTPALGPVQVAGELAVSEPAGMLTDIPPLDLLHGGPLVDVDGRIVGMFSPRYRVFSSDPTVVPIRLLCEQLMRGCPP